MLRRLTGMAPWLALTTAVVFLGPPGATVAAQKAPVNANAATLKDFVARVNQYIALHKKLEATIPALPKQTTPALVDQHERALGALIKQARASAKQGDLFTPAMQTLVRTLFKPIFSGPEGTHLKAEIVDNEYTGSVKIEVNGRYPDDVPLSTMPAQVLKALPPLSEELEYRFILHTLILLDTHAHIIADFVDRSFT